MGPGESELLCICMPPDKYIRNQSELGSIQSGPDDWIASAANIDLAQAMITTQHLVHIQHKNGWKWAKAIGRR